MYNKVNAALSESQVSKFKNAIKNSEPVTLRLSRSMFGTDKTQYPHELMLTDTQVNKLKRKDVADIKFSKTQIKSMIQSGGFLASLMRFAMPLLKNVIAPLGLTAAMSATDASIQKSIRGSGVTLTISDSDLSDILEIINMLEQKGILINGTTQTVENEVHEQKGGFLSMLLGTLGASLLRNLLSGNRGRGVVRAGEDF